MMTQKSFVAHQPMSRSAALALQIAIVIVFLASWEFVPMIPGLADQYVIFNPFFISSPSLIAAKLWGLITGTSGFFLVDYLVTTLVSFFAGTAIGVVGGALFGLILGNSVRLNQVLRPFLVAINAIPRVAMIPIFVIVFGPSFQTTALTTIFVVFFVVFFNAYEGARSVPTQLVQNSQLLGASRWRIMGQVRVHYVIAWTFGCLPNAVTFGLLAALTAEILTGYAGLGRLLVTSANNADSSLTFTVVVVLAALGVVLVGLTETARKVLLRWWD